MGRAPVGCSVSPHSEARQLFSPNCKRAKPTIPDGDHVAYVVQTPGRAHSSVVSLLDTKPRELPGVLSNVGFAHGRVFHVTDAALVAQSFDTKTLKLADEREVVAKPIASDGQFNYGAFAVAANGTVAYEESTGPAAMNELVTLDRTGKQLSTMTSGRPEENLDGVRVAPRGDRIAYNGSIASRNDVWVMQLKGGMRTRISLTANGGSYAVWSPDGNKVLYQNGIGGDQLLVRASNGVGNEHLVAKLNGQAIPLSWPPPGNHVLFEFSSAAPGSQAELWVAPVDQGDSSPHPLVRGVVNFGSAVSRDGKWLAYSSTESGRAEVYVIPLNMDASPDAALASGRWQVSTEGGWQPRWDAAGNELFFVNTSQTALYSVAINAENGKFVSGTPRKLFDLPLHPNWAFYDIAPNSTIYMLRYVGRESSPLSVLLN